MQEPEIVRFLASFEHPQACSPQGQTPLGMGVAAQLLQDTKDLLELQLWESALILVRGPRAACDQFSGFTVA